MKKILLLIFAALLFMIPATMFAHRPDRSLIYLRIYEADGIEGRFELNVHELNEFLGLNLKMHPKIEDVKPYQEQIEAYILKHAAFSSVYGKHEIVFTGEISRLWVNYGSFINFHFKLGNIKQLPDELEVSYSVFLQEDPSHTNVLGIEYNWKAGLINNESMMALDFTPGNYTKTLSLTDTSVWKGFMAMIRQGIWHIWIGFDHILFLVALILPSVVRRRRDDKVDNPGNARRVRLIDWGWEPVPKFKPAFIYIIKVITFFTIAHTITLSLASLQIINIPSRVVESIIALSIGLAAYHNIKPVLIGREWIIAFIFGLFHGFGFASVLGELGFRGEYLSLSLLGFNLGVEIGQVAIIAAIFPFLYLLRKRWIYPRLLIFMSGLLILISLYWFVERAFDIDLTLDESLRVVLYKVRVSLGLVEEL